MDTEQLRQEIERRLKGRIGEGVEVALDCGALSAEFPEPAIRFLARLRYGAATTQFPDFAALESDDGLFIAEYMARQLETLLRKELAKLAYLRDIKCAACARAMGQCDEGDGLAEDLHFCSRTCARHWARGQ